MADITKCSAKNCKIKDKCYRYTAIDGIINIMLILIKIKL